MIARSKHLWVTIILLLSIGSFEGLGQGLDPSFSPQIKGAPLMRALAIQSDGKIIAAGGFASVGTKLIKNIVRINPDGSIDETFSNSSLGDVEILNLQVSTSGKILIKQHRNRDIIILNNDGSIDETYVEPDDHFETYGMLGIDSKYLLLGHTSDGTKLVRLNENGSKDESFTAGSVGANTLFYNMKKLADGKILLAGGLTTYNDQSANGIALINEDGTLDTSFSSGSGPDGSNKLIRDFIVQPDGKIVIVGSFDSFNGVSTPGGIARLNVNGSFDQSFVTGVGANLSEFNYQIEQQQDGKLVIGGKDLVFRLNADGSIDNSFSNISLVQQNFFGSYSMVKTESDEIIVSSGFVHVNGTSQIGVFRSDKDGNIQEFDPQIRGSRFLTITGVVKQSDDKIVIGGQFFEVGEDKISGIARINPDGSLDKTFTPAVDFTNPELSRVSSLGIQSDGKIIVGGYFNNFSTRHRLIRLNTDGSLDETFKAVVSSTFIDSGVTEIIIGSNDEIYIAGSISFVNGQSATHIAKLNADGTTFSEFTTNTSPLGSTQFVRDIKLTSDGKILMGGVGFLYRLNSNGEVDPSFQDLSGVEDLNIYSIEILGERILAGAESRTGGVTTKQVFLSQFDLDGNVLDRTSIAISGSNNIAEIRDILVFKETEDVIIAGDFVTANSAEHVSIARFKVNGRVDNTFNFNATRTASGMLKLSESEILLFGNLVKVNNTDVLGIAKLSLTNVIPKITGAEELSTNEDESITLSLDHFTVIDTDDSYPEDFTLTVNEGENYTIAGTVLTPDENFNGQLTVSVVVNDGSDDSDPFELPISVIPVNDIPQITGTTSELSTEEESPLDISLSDLTVIDPDNTFPDDFSFTITTGENYSFTGNQVTPDLDFNGNLNVMLTVNDGSDNSSPTPISVQVTPVNDKPVITGVVEALITDSETPITIQLTSLTVTDPDNTYPNDFTLVVGEGDSYSLTGTTVSAAIDFIGNLSVPVVVNDGTIDSEPFDLIVEVDMATSLDLEEVSKQLTISPNPSASWFTVSLENEIYQDVNIRILKLTGESILNRTSKKATSLFQQTIDIQNLSPGIYLVLILQGKEYGSIKKLIRK